MTVVAHEDDSLLFQSPDLLHAIQNGSCVRSVYVTAGDAGAGMSHATSRENGAEAAYAEMAGVADNWTQSDAGVSGHPMVLQTLAAKPNISIVFIRLPDGNIGTGAGYPSTGFESLQKLWGGTSVGTISTIHAIDGSTSYTRQGLIDTLLSLFQSFQPATIDVQDYVGTFGDGDHSDHHASAYFAREAHKRYTTAHTFVGYMDYASASQPQHVFGSDLTGKQNAFFTYAQYDTSMCGSVSACSGVKAGGFLKAQYTVGSESGGAGANQTVASGASVQLDGSTSSDPAGKSLTYQWTQTAGPTVTLSSATAAKPTFSAPTGPASLTFQLLVNNGQQSSSPANVTITVNAPSTQSTNVAGQATVTASSQNTSTQQTAAKAVDGVIDGYPGDYTKEWATIGGGAGSWLKLVWSSPQTLTQVVLYDRPNLDDQITAATLTWSDGTVGVRACPALNEAGRRAQQAAPLRAPAFASQLST